MTFTKEEIENITIDTEDEWQFEDNYMISCRFYGIEEFVERFFNKTREEYGDSWIDCYAYIDCQFRVLDHIDCVFTLNEIGEHNRELRLTFTNVVEPAMILKRLMETSNGGLEQMMMDAMENDEGEIIDA